MTFDWLSFVLGSVFGAVAMFLGGLLLQLRDEEKASEL
jgi:hypothetical protein